jgi:hypothetical protein
MYSRPNKIDLLTPDLFEEIYKEAVAKSELDRT